MPLPTIKSTSYPTTEPNTYFVSNTGTDSTSSGSEVTPYKTVTYAVTKVPSGSTLVLRAGSYRENVLFPNKNFTVQPYPNEQVWIMGSSVIDTSDWIVDGALWRRDNCYIFSQYALEIPAEPNGSISVDPAHPEAAYVEQVFIDGVPQQQVLTKEAVLPGCFFNTRTTADGGHKFWIGTDPTGKFIEITRRAPDGRPFLWYMDGPESGSNMLGSVFRGLGFAHGAQFGLYLKNITNAVVENCTFIYNHQFGLKTHGSGIQIRGNLATYNGEQGMSVSGNTNGIIEGNTWSYNNQHLYFHGCGASGIKITRGADTKIRDNVAAHNLGVGIWFDLNVTRAEIVRNHVRNNTYHGIFFEASKEAIIADNLVHHNNQCGINYHNSNGPGYIFHNTCVRNGVNIGVGDTTRTNPVASERDAGYTYTTGDVTVKNNILSNTSGPGLPGWNNMMFSVYSDKYVVGRTFLTEMDYNACYRSSIYDADGNTDLLPEKYIRYFFRANSNTPIEKTGNNYLSRATFRAAQPAYQASGSDVQGNPAADVNPFFINEALGDYRIKSGSPAQNGGATLPSAVATAIGKSTNTTYNLGALYLTSAIANPEPLPQPEERIGRFLVSNRTSMIKVLRIPETAREVERVTLSMTKVSVRGKTIAKWILTILDQATDLQEQITRLTESELLEERGDATVQIAQLKEVNNRLSLALRLGYAFPS